MYICVCVYTNINVYIYTEYCDICSYRFAQYETVRRPYFVNGRLHLTAVNLTSGDCFLGLWAAKGSVQYKVFISANTYHGKHELNNWSLLGSRIFLRNSIDNDSNFFVCFYFSHMKILFYKFNGYKHIKYIQKVTTLKIIRKNGGSSCIRQIHNSTIIPMLMLYLLLKNQNLFMYLILFM